MILGLAGYARCGKDTVAQILIENHGFERIAFADPIREFLLGINPILDKGNRLSTLVEEYGWEIAKAQTEVRRLLQDLGVSARELIDPLVWVNAAVKKMDDPSKNYVITDVRFENEAETIKGLGGEIWRVERPGVTAVNSHVSESNLGTWEFDRYIHNSGTLEDLKLLVQLEMRA